MNKLTSIQNFLTNDLRLFRAPFFENMRARPAGEGAVGNEGGGEEFYSVPALDFFETWLINGIVGGRHPSTYSESPDLWNPYFEGIQEGGVFFGFDLPSERDFPNFLKALLSVPGFLDLTVTDPYKHRAYRTLIELGYPFEFSHQAEHTQTVNHIIMDSGKNMITALNTDGLGMTRAIRSKTKISDKKVLIIGAGGSAASIGYEFIRLGNDLFIINRTPARAEMLTQRLTVFAPSHQRVRWDGFGKVNGALEESDIIINTVSEGCPVNRKNAGLIKKGALLAETKYGDKSELKDMAAEFRCEYVDGRAMLFGQFVEAVNHVYPILEVSLDVHEEVIREIEMKRSDDC